MTTTSPTTPGAPVLAVLVDAQGQIVLLGQVTGDARLSEIKNQLHEPPKGGDLTDGGFELALESTRLPGALDQPLFQVTTTVKWCVDKLGNIVVCRPRP